MKWLLIDRQGEILLLEYQLHLPNKILGEYLCKVCADKEKYISGKRGRKETSFYCK